METRKSGIQRKGDELLEAPSDSLIDDVSIEMRHRE
jgi:hypothetical protein